MTYENLNNVKEKQKLKLRHIIKGLAKVLYKTHMNERNVFPLLLCGDEIQRYKLDLTDILYHLTLKALRVGDYKHAISYLVKLSRICEITFGDENMGCVNKTLNEFDVLKA